MAIMDQINNRIGVDYDADAKTFNKTIKALEVLMYARRAPKEVRIQARQLHDAALYTGRVGATGDWIRVQWASYVTVGSYVWAALSALIVLVAFQDALGLVFGGALGLSVYFASRELRREGVRRSGSIPKA